MWVRSLGGEDPPRGGHGNPLQYSCLENPVDREAWRATVRGVMDTTDPAQTLGARTFTIVTQSLAGIPGSLCSIPSLPLIPVFVFKYTKHILFF